MVPFAHDGMFPGKLVLPTSVGIHKYQSDQLCSLLILVIVSSGTRGKGELIGSKKSQIPFSVTGQLSGNRKATFVIDNLKAIELKRAESRIND